MRSINSTLGLRAVSAHVRGRLIGERYHRLALGEFHYFDYLAYSFVLAPFITSSPR